MRVSIIYLAAGNSRRFGKNKLLHEIEGKAMYLHLLNRLRKIVARHKDWELLVVSQYPEILEESNGYLRERAIDSPLSKEGISWSIQAGVDQTEDAEAIAFFVADQPNFTEETAEAFLTEMEKRKASLGCVFCEGHTGNPTWFSKGYFGELKELQGDQGGKSILKKYQKVEYFEVSSEKELEDIDYLTKSKGL